MSVSATVTIMPFPVPLVLHVVLATGLSLRVLYRKLQVNSALAWIVLLIAMPIAGPVLYVLFGDPTLGQRRLRLGERIRDTYQQAHAAPERAGVDLAAIPEPFGALAGSMARASGFPVLAHNRHGILTDAGAILEAMAHDIALARRDCCLEFYIIDPRGRVEAVLDAVLAAARRGVVCRILADDFGSKGFFGSTWATRLREAGVEIVRSLPVGLIKSLSKRSDLRNHRKQLICDRAVVYTGSFNLVDPHLFKSGAHVGEWIDIVMRIEGPIVDALGVVFETDFVLDRPGGRIDDVAVEGLPPRVQGDGPAQGRMQLLPSGPEMPNSTIYEFIVATIFNARHRVRIVTPYFIPDQAVLLALKSAAQRGVAVEIVVPARGDSRMAHYAGRASFDELLEAGVAILCFGGGLLHAKAMLIDEGPTLFGTVNMDMRSFYLNLELSLIHYEPAVNAELDRVIDGYAAQCTALTREDWAHRPARQRFLENLFRLAGPLL